MNLTPRQQDRYENEELRMYSHPALLVDPEQWTLSTVYLFKSRGVLCNFA